MVCYQHYYYFGWLAEDQSGVSKMHDHGGAYPPAAVWIQFCGVPRQWSYQTGWLVWPLCCPCQMYFSVDAGVLVSIPCWVLVSIPFHAGVLVSIPFHAGVLVSILRLLVTCTLLSHSMPSKDSTGHVSRGGSVNWVFSSDRGWPAGAHGNRPLSCAAPHPSWWGHH